MIFLSGYERVERSNLDGTQRQIIINSLTHPFSLTVLDQNLYWTDWQTNSVYRLASTTHGRKFVVKCGGTA